MRVGKRQPEFRRQYSRAQDIKEDIIIIEEPNEDPITEDPQWNRLTKDSKKGPITEDFKRALSLKAPTELRTDQKEYNSKNQILMLLFRF